MNVKPYGTQFLVMLFLKLVLNIGTKGGFLGQFYDAMNRWSVKQPCVRAWECGVYVCMNVCVSVCVFVYGFGSIKR